VTQTVDLNKKIYSPSNVFNFVFFSLLGIFLFFVPFTVNGTNSIAVDHIITYMNRYLPWLGPTFTLIIGTIGGILPWVQKTYKKGVMDFIMAVFRTLGIPICFLAYFNVGPAWLMDPGMLPFLWEKVVVSVTVIVAIGSIFLTFVIAFGCLEFVGVLVRPIMRPVFKTPGKSAIDAVASFVGSFSLAIYLTNKLYRESKYTMKEAFIIMSGFSTVSATFMITVAKTAGFMGIWNFYFWTTLIITFVVTAITVRLWPITKVPETYLDGVGHPEEPVVGKSIFRAAVDEGLEAAQRSKNILKTIWENLAGGIKMCFVLTPVMGSIGLLAFILVKLTNVFDIIGYIFYPFTYLISLIGVPEPLMIAKASAATIAEMFVPNVVVSSLGNATKYVVAVTSVSQVLFFGGSLPCYMASDVKVPLWKVMIVVCERIALSIILAGIVAVIYF